MFTGQIGLQTKDRLAGSTISDSQPLSHRRQGWNKKLFPLQTERIHLSRLLSMLFSHLDVTARPLVWVGRLYGIMQHIEASSNPRPHIKDLPPELRIALYLMHAAWWSLTSESPTFRSIIAGATFIHRCQSWASERKCWPLASDKWIWKHGAAQYGSHFCLIIAPLCRCFVRRFLSI